MVRDEPEDEVFLCGDRPKREWQRAERIHVKASANGSVHGRDPPRYRHFDYCYTLNGVFGKWLEVGIVERQDHQVAVAGLGMLGVEST